VLEKKPSEADYYIEDLDGVRSLLEKLCTNTQKRKRTRSYSDLTKLAGDGEQLKDKSTKKTLTSAQSTANVSPPSSHSIAGPIYALEHRPQ
jgi:hypothetical protein